MPSAFYFLVMAAAFLLAGAPQVFATERSPLYEVDVLVRQQEGKLVEGKVRSHTLLVDQPRHFSGTDSAPTPPETYAFSVGACLVSALRFVGELENLPVSNIQVRVQGALDISKAMGVDMAKRAGFPALSLVIRFDAPWDVKEKKIFVERVMERCPICDNTINPTTVEIDIKD